MTRSYRGRISNVSQRHQFEKSLEMSWVWEEFPLTLSWEGKLGWLIIIEECENSQLSKITADIRVLHKRYSPDGHLTIGS